MDPSKTYDLTGGFISGQIAGHPMSAGAKMPIDTPELGIVNDAMAEAMKMASRVEELADRICGCRDTPEGSLGGGGAMSQPDGVAPRMADTARSVAQAVSRAHGALSRIESVLP